MLARSGQKRPNNQDLSLQDAALLLLSGMQLLRRSTGTQLPESSLPCRGRGRDVAEALTCLHVLGWRPPRAAKVYPYVECGSSLEVQRVERQREDTLVRMAKRMEMKPEM